jgi:hypothetical protein
MKRAAQRAPGNRYGAPIILLMAAFWVGRMEKAFG